jgi:predicted aspartyl protease
MSLYRLAFFTMFVVYSALVRAAEPETSLPLHQGTGETFYVDAGGAGQALTKFLVDTGSGYVVINRTTLSSLERQSQATYVRDVNGTMADGSRTTVPVYRIASFQVGCCCPVNDVEVAVFPDARRQILGLSALKKLAPFSISFDPPRLQLSQCDGAATHPGAPPIKAAGGSAGAVASLP